MSLNDKSNLWRAIPKNIIFGGNVKNVRGYTNICVGLHKDIKAGNVKKIGGILKIRGK